MNTPANRPVVRALSESNPHASLVALTEFTYIENASAESRLLAELGAIDLHHGPYSSTTPYKMLAVIGVQLTTAIEAALSSYAFFTIELWTDEFIATRSDEEASRRRE